MQSAPGATLAGTLLTACSYTLHHRKSVTNGNADPFSRFPLPPVEEDLMGHRGISMPGDVGVHFVHFSERTPPHSSTDGVAWVGERPRAREILYRARRSAARMDSTSLAQTANE